LRIGLLGFLHGTVAVRVPPQIEPVSQIWLMATVGVLLMNLVVAVFLSIFIYIEVGHRNLPP